MLDNGTDILGILLGRIVDRCTVEQIEMILLTAVYKTK